MLYIGIFVTQLEVLLESLSLAPIWAATGGLCMSECIFCRVAAGKIPADKIFEGKEVVAFRDINPQAPHHVLIIPRKHIESVNDLGEDDAALVAKMVLAAKEIAAKLGVAQSGYRLVLNTNRAAGQAVPHIHLHLLGGRNFSWPPG
jgi:histidine triad (HIT) family protein